MAHAQTNPTAHMCLDQASIGKDATFLSSNDLLTQARMLLQFIRNRLYTQALNRWEVPGNTPMTHEQA